ncbi:LysR family transcriptional regulator [Actinoplanes sp. NPDC049265]|uniref:LysR family transcriptional regulator n=1 Tax=Actinoplanes sp. NPDC049265 TaxID=3363902 RepID=UPI003722015A
MLVDISTRLVRYAVALAEEGHFGRAARSLGVSQPALSRGIAQLESQVAAVLFHRDRVRVVPTAAGADFLRFARRGIEELDNAVRAARNSGRGETGSLRIGVIASALLELLPRVLPRFTADFPAIHVRLEQMPTSEGTEAVAQGDIDVAIGRGMPPGDHAAALLSAPVERNHMIAVVHRGHPLAGQKQVTAQQITAWPLILSPTADEPRTGAAIRDLLATRPPDDEPIEGRGVHSIITLAASGLGVGLGPNSLRSLGHGDVWMADLIPAIPLPDLVVVIQPPLRNPALRSFLKVLASVVPAYARGIEDMAERAGR